MFPLLGRRHWRGWRSFLISPAALYGLAPMVATERTHGTKKVLWQTYRRERDSLPSEGHRMRCVSVITCPSCPPTSGRGAFRSTNRHRTPGASSAAREREIAGIDSITAEVRRYLAAAAGRAAGGTTLPAAMRRRRRGDRSGILPPTATSPVVVGGTAVPPPPGSGTPVDAGVPGRERKYNMIQRQRIG